MNKHLNIVHRFNFAGVFPWLIFVIHESVSALQQMCCSARQTLVCHYRHLRLLVQLQSNHSLLVGQLHNASLWHWWLTNRHHLEGLIHWSYASEIGCGGKFQNLYPRLVITPFSHVTFGEYGFILTTLPSSRTTKFFTFRL